jgi:hypothetical protein
LPRINYFFVITEVIGGEAKVVARVEPFLREHEDPLHPSILIRSFSDIDLPKMSPVTPPSIETAPRIGHARDLSLVRQFIHHVVQSSLIQLDLHLANITLQLSKEEYDLLQLRINDILLWEPHRTRIIRLEKPEMPISTVHTFMTVQVAIRQAQLDLVPEIPDQTAYQVYAQFISVFSAGQLFGDPNQSYLAVEIHHLSVDSTSQCQRRPIFFQTSPASLNKTYSVPPMLAVTVTNSVSSKLNVNEIGTCILLSNTTHVHDPHSMVWFSDLSNFFATEPGR